MSKKLSIVIPAYNEEKTLELIIEKVIQIDTREFKKEIIIVNDCSKDSTLEKAESLAKKYKEIQVISNAQNSGKSQSVKNGILHSTGEYVIIQDADLEYDPEDIPPMLQYIQRYNCDVVYGNRFGVDNGVGYIANFFGNLFISFVSNLFTMWHFRVYISDMEVCYKLIKGDLAREIAQTITSTSNFGIEPEITAKLAKRKAKMVVVPVKYYPRTIEEGKKMHALKDGMKAIVEIVRFNLFD